MVDKEYISPEYYAQTCRDFLKGVKTDEEFLKGLPKEVKKDIYDIFGASFDASYHDGRVFFKVQGIECLIDFGDKKIETPDVNIEIINKNGFANSYPRKMKEVVRSSSGRLNPVKTYIPFFENSIIPFIKQALK